MSAASIPANDSRALLRGLSPAPGFAPPFNHRWVADKVLVTSFLGDWILLEPDAFQAFVEGRPRPGDPLYERLRERRLIAAELDLAAEARRYWTKRSFLTGGPSLHGFVLTERCNHGCQYCHSSVVGMGRTDTDMSIEVADKAVQFALASTSNWVNIEFQGGEPTANWETLAYVVHRARELNAERGKTLTFSLVTNFSLMDDEKLDFLVENKVQICTSLDGPEDLHNSIRIYNAGNSYQLTTEWIRKTNERYVAMGLDPTLYRVEALPTITRASLQRPREIIDAYVKAGCRAIFLRKLDPFGFAARTRHKLGYSMTDYLRFYAEALDYAIELNIQGIEVLERHAAIMLCKILSDTEPNYLDLRSPGGAAIGQLGYHPDGSVYSSDEGRMVAAMGDDAFYLGNAMTQSYREVMESAAVKGLVVAATNEANPDCASCVYQPYCGLQPEYNYKTQGSIFGRMRDSDWCRKHMGIFDILVGKLASATAEEMAVLERWTICRTQEHFIEPPAELVSNEQEHP